MKRISVVFISDEKYIVHLSVALISLLNNNKNYKFNVCIIGSGINNKNFDKLKKICDFYDVNIKQFIVEDKMFDKLITKYHFTKAIYYRLLIPHFIDDDKVLYLDSDIVINSSIKDMLNINLNNNYIAAVINPGFKCQKEFKMDLNAKYFNSGVMLINNYLWKRDNIFKKCIDFIESHSNKILFPDQDALNAVINGNWIELPLKYNVQSVFFEKNIYNRYPELNISELKYAIKNPVVIHYTGSSKPWHICNKHPYKYLYWKYLKLTPFKKYLPEINYINIINYKMINKKPKNTITIPYNVKIGRRNYNFIIEFVKSNKNFLKTNNIKFNLLGNIEKDDGKSILNLIRKNKLEEYFIIHHGFINYKDFIKNIQDSLCIMPLLNDNSYLKYTTSAALNMSFSLNKPLLIEKKYKKCNFLENFTYFYSDENLVLVLERIVNKDAYFEKVKNILKHNKFTLEYQINKLRKII